MQQWVRHFSNDCSRVARSLMQQVHKIKVVPTHPYRHTVPPRTQVPAPTAPYDTVPAFLQALQPACHSYASKFVDWQHLMTARHRSLVKLGIPCKIRKHILAFTERYRNGIMPYAIAQRKREQRRQIAKIKADAAKRADLLAKRAST